MPIDSMTLAEREELRERRFRWQVAAMLAGGSVAVLIAYGIIGVLWMLR